MVDAPHTNKNKATALVIARVCVLCMSEFEAPKKYRHQASYIFSKLTSACCGICMHCAVLYARCATYSATYSAQHVARHVPRSMLRDMFRATCTYSAQHALVNFEKIYPDTARTAHNKVVEQKKNEGFKTYCSIQTTGATHARVYRWSMGRIYRGRGLALKAHWVRIYCTSFQHIKGDVEVRTVSRSL